VDSKDKEEIFRHIPHRPPFLWVDKIVAIEAGSITTEKHIPVDLEVFQGHYPNYPILPGVLLCEAVFQSGAILIAHDQTADGTLPAGIPVLTRIANAKFKREIRPGETITIQVAISEIVGSAWFLKGRALVNEKKALTIEFCCKLLEDAQQE